MSDLSPTAGLRIEVDSEVGADIEPDRVWHFVSDPAAVLPLVGPGRMLGAGHGYALTEPVDGWLGELTAGVVDEDRRRVEYLIRARGEIEPRVGNGVAILELRTPELAGTPADADAPRQDAPAVLGVKLELSAMGAEIDEATLKAGLESFLADAVTKAKSHTPRVVETFTASKVEAAAAAAKPPSAGGPARSAAPAARGKGSGLHIANSFEVRVPVEDVWPALLDIERVAGYLPGATVEPGEEEGTFKGAMSVKLGPVKVGYSGTVRLVEVDEVQRRAVMDIKAREKRGQGGVGARIVNQLVEQDGGTRVEVDTELQISGKQAQFGRGIMESVATRMLGDFARRFEQDLLSEAPASAAGDGRASSDSVAVYEPPAWRTPALAGAALAAFVASILAWTKFRKR